MLILAGVVLYWIPARYLIMGWGINKFARKIIRPHTVPNNEVLDLLSRVPDDMDLVSSYNNAKVVNFLSLVAHTFPTFLTWDFRLLTGS